MTETLNQPEDKILDRIAKLLAVVEDDRAPQGERDSALARMQALMLKHTVDEHQLRGRLGHKSETVIFADLIVGTAYSETKCAFAAHIAYAFRCRAIQLYSSMNARRAHNRNPKNPTVTIRIFGFESDVAVVQTLWASLSIQMAAACEKEYRGQGRTWKNNYYAGFSQRVNRLNEGKKAAEAAEPGMGLALRDVKKDVDRAFEDMYPRTTTKAVQRRSDYGGIAAGQRAGDRADLGRNQVAGKSRALGS